MYEVERYRSLHQVTEAVWEIWCWKTFPHRTSSWRRSLDRMLCHVIEMLSYWWSLKIKFNVEVILKLLKIVPWNHVFTVVGKYREIMYSQWLTSTVKSCSHSGWQVPWNHVFTVVGIKFCGCPKTYISKSCTLTLVDRFMGSKMYIHMDKTCSLYHWHLNLW